MTTRCRCGRPIPARPRSWRCRCGRLRWRRVGDRMDVILLVALWSAVALSSGWMLGERVLGAAPTSDMWIEHFPDADTRIERVPPEPEQQADLGVVYPVWKGRWVL